MAAGASVEPSTPEIARALDEWVEQCRARRGSLPAGVAPVQVRRIRAVGRTELPGVGPVYLKVMGFPRFRDRIRYWFRSLPAVHEARMLARARDAGLCAPRVWCAHGERDAVHWPRLSLLVTEALEVAPGGPPPRALAEAAARMAAVGIFAPDLHPGNFLPLRDGRLGVIDLQSARPRAGVVGGAERQAMAAKLLSERPDCAEELVASGLVEEADLSGIRRRATEIHAAALVRRIRRCMVSSTEFAVDRSLRGKTFRRREVSPAADWIEGGAELMQCWIGDRALEVLDGRSPSLAALFRKSWWLPGQHSVKIRPASAAGARDLEGSVLKEGFERFQALIRGGFPERHGGVSPG